MTGTSSPGLRVEATLVPRVRGVGLGGAALDGAGLGGAEAVQHRAPAPAAVHARAPRRRALGLLHWPAPAALVILAAGAEVVQHGAWW